MRPPTIRIGTPHRSSEAKNGRGQRSYPSLLPLTGRRQRGDVRESCGLGTRVSSFLSELPCPLIEGGPHGVEQGIAVERLAEERAGAGLQRSLACLVVAVSSQNHRGDPGARSRKVSEEVETIHSGHPEIEHQTGGLFWMDRLQEGFGRSERLDAEAD
jgi:hypothetical protein